MTTLCSSTPPDGQARVGRVASGGERGCADAGDTRATQVVESTCAGIRLLAKKSHGSNTRQAASICERAIETGTLFPVVFLLPLQIVYRRTPFLFLQAGFHASSRSEHQKWEF